MPEPEFEHRIGPRRRRVLVVAGETSGERHMAQVMGAVKRLAPDLQVEWFGSGGPEMARQQLDCFLDVSQLAAIGPLAALTNAGAYLRLYRRLLRESKSRRPDLAVLVDFPEFNLRLARSLKKRNVPVCYFISPQVWAWRQSRVGQIRRYVDRMLVIFPFEEEFYRRHGVEAHFVGNPSAALRDQALEELPPLDDRAARVALLPGSRRQEVEQILPLQLAVAARLSRARPVQFRLLAAPGLPREWLASRIESWRRKQGELPPLKIVPGEETHFLASADCALVKSGTSTLEAMILQVPFAMVYRMSPWSYRLLAPWVRTKTFCLANLVAGEVVAPEFVQAAAQPEAISHYLLKLLSEPGRLKLVKQKLKIASEKLGSHDAYPEAARHIVEILKDGIYP